MCGVLIPPCCHLFSFIPLFVFSLCALTEDYYSWTVNGCSFNLTISGAYAAKVHGPETGTWYHYCRIADDEPCGGGPCLADLGAASTLVLIVLLFYVLVGVCTCLMCVLCPSLFKLFRDCCGEEIPSANEMERADKQKMKRICFIFIIAHMIILESITVAAFILVKDYDGSKILTRVFTDQIVPDMWGNRTRHHKFGYYSHVIIMVWWPTIIIVEFFGYISARFPQTTQKELSEDASIDKSNCLKPSTLQKQQKRNHRQHKKTEPENPVTIHLGGIQTPRENTDSEPENPVTIHLGGIPTPSENTDTIGKTQSSGNVMAANRTKNVGEENGSEPPEAIEAKPNAPPATALSGSDRPSAKGYREVLNEIGLKSFARQFKNEGWTDPSLFTGMTDENLEDCGLRAGHIARFRRVYPLNDHNGAAPPSYYDAELN